MGNRMTLVGRFVRQLLESEPDLNNRDIAQRVKQHFPEKDFDEAKLRQYVANCKYLAKLRGISGVR